MSRKPFEIGRPDGRTNAQVLIDIVHNFEPGHLFTYADLIERLSWEERRFDVRGVQCLVTQSAHKLLQEESRALRNVKNVGYKVAKANEHVPMALVRRERADMQLKRGIDILRNVRFEEMNESERAAHEGHLLVTEAIYRNQLALQRRQSKVEDLITGLTQRIEELAAR